MKKFRNNVFDRKQPTYLFSPNKDLPGIFDKVPVNRAARRRQGREDNRKYPPTVSPLLRGKGEIYFRVGFDLYGKTTPHWRVSRRKGIRKFDEIMRKREYIRRIYKESK